MKNLQITLPRILAFGFAFLLLLTTCNKSNDGGEETTTQINAQDFTTTIDENPTQGTEVGTISASTNQGVLSFSIISQSSQGAISVDTSTGVITVNDTAAFDYETVTAITASVRVSSGDTFALVNITVNLNDLDENMGNLGDAEIWTGTTVTFTKPGNADPTAEDNQDRITDGVWITRGNDGGEIYNIKVESASIKGVSPEDTAWALGTIENVENLSFASFRSTITPKDVVDQDLVLHLISENIYLSVKFTSWSVGKAGGFAYERSTKN